MRPTTGLLALSAILGYAWAASAQSVSVQFRDGLVSLTAQNATVGRVLAEWARVGGVTIVNGDRIPGAPVTLQLDNVPERQALDILLRQAAGYIVAGREGATPGASLFDRILVLPTSSRPAAGAALPQPTPPPPPPPDPVEDQDPFIEQPGVNTAPVNPFSRVPPGPRSDDVPVPIEEPTPEAVAPDGGELPVDPGNPFGVLPGSAQPGTISPVPRSPQAPVRGR